MAKVVLAWEQGSGLGHCAKLAPIATQLIAQGHDVFFAARDVTTAQYVLPDPGLRLLQAPCLLARPATVLRQTRTFAQVLHNVGFGDDHQLRSLVTSWRNLFELVRPDLVICEHAPTALLASRWIDCRRIVVGTGFSVPPDVSPLPDLCYWDPQSTRSNLFDDEFVLRDRVNRLLVGDGLPPLDRFAQLYGDADQSFLVTFQELDHHSGRGIAEYWGNWSLTGGGHVRAATDRPRILAYLKPSSGPWKVEPLLEVLAGQPVLTKAYVPGINPTLKKYQSPTLQIVSEPLNLTTQLQDCRLAIVNGTAGTSTHCLLAGVPLLMLPLVFEQIVFSRRIVDLGAGLMMPPHRPELFGAKLGELLRNQSFHDAATAFARRYADYDPRERQAAASARIEACISSR